MRETYRVFASVAGLYGRLDKDKWFKTTVTNVEPTAKQSWVLNPWVSVLLDAQRSTVEGLTRCLLRTVQARLDRARARALAGLPGPLPVPLRDSPSGQNGE